MGPLARLGIGRKKSMSVTNDEFLNNSAVCCSGDLCYVGTDGSNVVMARCVTKPLDALDIIDVFPCPESNHGSSDAQSAAVVCCYLN